MNRTKDAISLYDTVVEWDLREISSSSSSSSNRTVSLTVGAHR